MSQKYLLIYRDERFSPNAVERDKAMLDTVARLIKANRSSEVHTLHERELPDVVATDYADCTVIHMTRSAEALAKLEEMQALGALIINAPTAIRDLNRTNIEAAMTENGIPTPARLIAQHPELGSKGWWIKANDTTDSSPSHIQFQESLPIGQEDTTNNLCIQQENILIQPHIEGQDIKFYGVRGTDFFKVREVIPTAVSQQLRDYANTLAKTLSLDIYGGDAILTADGRLTIIDLNDFPSFSSCREEAAEAIYNTIHG